MADSDIVSKTGDVAFKSLHPTAKGGGTARGIGGKDIVAWGGSDGLESKYLRCKQCGFVVNRQRNPIGSGWGNIEQEIQVQTISYDQSNTHYDESNVTYDGIDYVDTIGNAGCPFCGASEYE